MRTRSCNPLLYIVAIIAVLMAAHPAAAQWTTSADTVTALGGLASESLWSSLGRLALALVVVIVLIWGTLWIAKRVMSGRLTGKRESPVRVLERAHLAPKRSIDVVSVGNRVLVLGVTEHSIALLTELAPGDLATTDSFADALRQKQSGERRHGDLLSQARKRLNDLFQTARVSESDAVTNP